MVLYDKGTLLLGAAVPRQEKPVLSFLRQSNVQHRHHAGNERQVSKKWMRWRGGAEGGLQPAVLPSCCTEYLAQHCCCHCYPVGRSVWRMRCALCCLLPIEVQPFESLRVYFDQQPSYIAINVRARTDSIAAQAGIAANYWASLLQAITLSAQEGIFCENITMLGYRYETHLLDERPPNQAARCSQRVWNWPWHRCPMHSQWPPTPRAAMPCLSSSHSKLL